MRKTALDAISFKRLPAHDTVARSLPALDAEPSEDKDEAKDAQDYGTSEGARKRAQGGAGSQQAKKKSSLRSHPYYSPGEGAPFKSPPTAASQGKKAKPSGWVHPFYRD